MLERQQPKSRFLEFLESKFKTELPEDSSEEMLLEEFEDFEEEIEEESSEPIKNESGVSDSFAKALMKSGGVR
jgi:hypothetical protein